MNKIVIVEDKLERGISLAEQFKDFSQTHPDLNIEGTDICYFCTDSDKAKKDIEKMAKCEFKIIHVRLINFSEIMDKYLYSEEDHNFLIMDFVLDNDGSEGTPIKRVNIRYARNKNRCATNQLWFYTATGAVNEQILGQLVGKEHTLEVLKVDDDHLRLRLEDENLIKALGSC